MFLFIHIICLTSLCFAKHVEAKHLFELTETGGVSDASLQKVSF